MNKLSSFYKNRDLLKFLLDPGSNIPLRRAVRMPEYRAFKRAVARALMEQYRSVADSIEFYTGTTKLDLTIVEKVNTHLISIKEFLKPIEILEYKILMAGVGGQYALEDMRLTGIFNLSNPTLIKQLEDETNLLITSVDNTTKKRIAKILSDETAKGSTNEEIVKRLTDIKSQTINLVRAELIAHAETMNAINQLQDETYLRNGVQRHRWKTSGDNRVTQECRANEAAGWVPIGSPFPHGPNNLRPPRFPRCRCRLEGDRKTRLPYTRIWKGE